MMRFALSLTLALCVAGVLLPTYGDEPYPPLILRDEIYSTPTPEQRNWALATCAVLTEYNRARHDLLGGMERTQENIKCELGLLAKWWGIRSREDLLDMLKWISDGGHRKKFDHIASHLRTLSPGQILDYRASVSADPEFSNRVDVVLKYHEELGFKSITCWDFDRYVALCGWGYVVGFLTEDEAWRRIMPAARLLQSTFSSWEDLGRNYLAGREFWSLEQTKVGGQRMRECYRKLLSDSSSPWAVIRWNTDLKTLHVTSPQPD